MSSSQASLESSPLPAQLAVCADDFRHAVEEVQKLIAFSTEEALRKRLLPSQWSPLECIVHLNLATRAMLPGIRQAVESATERTGSERNFKMDLPGRLLAWSLEPPAFIKMKAPKLAEPLETEGPEAALKEFEQLHGELLQLLHASSGKEIDKQKMKSPFANLHYNAYSAFRIIAAHDRRHLWQARKVLEANTRSSAAA